MNTKGSMAIQAEHLAKEIAEEIELKTCGRGWKGAERIGPEGGTWKL